MRSFDPPSDKEGSIALARRDRPNGLSRIYILLHDFHQFEVIHEQILILKTFYEIALQCRADEDQAPVNLIARYVRSVLILISPGLKSKWRNDLYQAVCRITNT